MSHPSLQIYFNHTETLEDGGGYQVLGAGEGTQYSLRGQIEVGVGLGSLLHRKAVISQAPGIGNQGQIPRVSRPL